jgi:C1A family cysteine protease
LYNISYLAVCTPSEYPNTGKQGACQNTACKFKISGFKTVATCDDLSSSIMNQPVSVAVDASNWSRYASGVFNNCGTSVNHFVLLVAMADSFWKCQNSWGTAWGEQGFIRLARGNTCGICLYGAYPTI